MKKYLVIIIFLIFTFVNTNHCLCNIKRKNETRVVVVGNNINVRKDPTTKSPILYQLKLAERVTILKESNIVYLSKQAKGNWVYIDTEYTKVDHKDSIKGWVVDYFLAKYSSFKKVNNFLSCSIEGTIGDWHMKYVFYKNGKYRREDYDYSTRKRIYKFGKIYKYRKVLFLKDNDGTAVDYFYFNHKGFLCHYQRNADGESICTKCSD